MGIRILIVAVDNFYLSFLELWTIRGINSRISGYVDRIFRIFILFEIKLTKNVDNFDCFNFSHIKIHSSS